MLSKPIPFAQLAWFALLLTAPAAGQAPDPARVPVQALDDGLMAIMKGGKQIGYAGRARTIGPVVDRAFDLPQMTRLTIGPAWTTIAPADQIALVQAFRRLTVAQYAGNFDGWSGQSFAIDPRIEARGADRLVKTTLSQPKGDATLLAYRLRQSAGQWRIVDVFYKNSISQIAMRRSDFASVLSKGGARALIGHLDQLAAKAAR